MTICIACYTCRSSAGICISRNDSRKSQTTKVQPKLVMIILQQIPHIHPIYTAGSSSRDMTLRRLKTRFIQSSSWTWSWCPSLGLLILIILELYSLGLIPSICVGLEKASPDYTERSLYYALQQSV